MAPKTKNNQDEDIGIDFNEIDTSATNRTVMRHSVRGVGSFVIHNILASAQLCDGNGKPVKLNLNDVADLFLNSYYDKVEFAALRLTYVYQGSSYAISIFESGRIQTTGGVNIDLANYVLLKIAKRMAVHLNVFSETTLSLENFDVQNILAVLDLERIINLERLAETVPGGVDYEPEKFPAARFRIPVDADFNPEDFGLTMEELNSGSAQNKHLTEMQRRATMDLRSEQEKAKSRSRISRMDKAEFVTINVFSSGKINFTGAK